MGRKSERVSKGEVPDVVNKTEDSDNNTEEQPVTEKSAKKKKSKKHKDKEEISQTANVFDTETDEKENGNVVTPQKKRRKNEADEATKEHQALESESVSKEDSDGNTKEESDIEKSAKKKKKRKNKDNDEKVNETEDSLDAKADEKDNEDVETPKKKKKREKKEAASGESAKEPQASTKPTAGLEYLIKWKNDRATWKFQTMRQVWLLQHMYNSSLIPDDEFPTMLDYVDSIKGKSREITLKKAQEMMTKHELAEENVSEGQDEEKQNSPDGQLLEDSVYDRVRQVIQLLL